MTDSDFGGLLRKSRHESPDDAARDGCGHRECGGCASAVRMHGNFVRRGELEQLDHQRGRRQHIRGVELGSFECGVQCRFQRCGWRRGQFRRVQRSQQHGAGRRHASRSVPTPPTRCRRRLTPTCSRPSRRPSGTDVKVNTVDHNSFQENINNYLQGSPDEVFTWFAGNRMQFFAAQGLLTPIDDEWSKFQSQYSDAFVKASTAADGKKYFVPFYNYPWAFFYRPSVFKAKGYEIPKTLDELKTLATKMKADGLVPIAFADKDGWPAMGTFDYLNQRINGYQFHMDLVATHKESWTDPKVKTVFDTWKGLFPYLQTGALGRTWQEAAQTLVKKQAGMYLLGMFVAQQFPAGDTDIDFFPFPEVDSNIGMDAVEAPIDGFLLSSKGTSDQSKALMSYLAIPGGAADLSQERPEQRRGQQDGEHCGLQRSAEARGRADRLGQDHLAVPRSRQPARLRQPGRHPGAAAVPQGRRHQRGDQESRRSGQDDLHLLICSV